MNFLFRTFVSLVVLRFILVAVVLLNGLANHAFLDQRRDELVEQLGGLPRDLEMKPEAAPADDLAAMDQKLEVARERLAESTRRLDSARSGMSLIDKYNPFRHSKVVDAAKAEISKGEDEVTALLVSRCNALRRSAAVAADAACQEVPLAARARTMAGAAGQAITATMKTAAAAVDLSILRQKVEDAVADMVAAMALFILQTLILPLLFLFALSKGVKAIWGLDLREMIARTRSLGREEGVPAARS